MHEGSLGNLNTEYEKIRPPVKDSNTATSKEARYKKKSIAPCVANDNKNQQGECIALMFFSKVSNSRDTTRVHNRRLQGKI